MSTIKVDTIQTTAGLTRNTICAQSNFDMSTTTINGSIGVSSFTDVSSGNWDFNFTNAMTSLGYAAGGFHAVPALSDVAALYTATNRTRTTSSHPVRGGAANAAWNAAYDSRDGGSIIWVDG